MVSALDQGSNSRFSLPLRKILQQTINIRRILLRMNQLSLLNNALRAIEEWLEKGGGGG